MLHNTHSILSVIYYFVSYKKNEKEKEKTKVTYRAMKGNRKRTHELERLSREKVSISRTGFFFFENRFHLAEKHGRGIFFFLKTDAETEPL
jgi:hypothetical protein